jgi:hypothetical protein
MLVLFEKLCLRFEEQELVKANWLEVALLFAVLEGIVRVNNEVAKAI